MRRKKQIIKSINKKDDGSVTTTKIKKRKSGAVVTRKLTNHRDSSFELVKTKTKNGKTKFLRTANDAYKSKVSKKKSL